MYFPLRANLRLFKFIPDEFVLTFCCCWQKVSQTKGISFEEIQGWSALQSIEQGITHSKFTLKSRINAAHKINLVARSS
jgi:hypothetical protein